MTGGARRFGRRCRHDFEFDHARHQVPEQQRAVPRQQAAEQPHEPDAEERGAEQPQR